MVIVLWLLRLDLRLGQAPQVQGRAEREAEHLVWCFRTVLDRGEGADAGLGGVRRDAGHGDVWLVEGCRPRGDGRGWVEVGGGIGEGREGGGGGVDVCRRVCDRSRFRRSGRRRSVCLPVSARRSRLEDRAADAIVFVDMLPIIRASFALSSVRLSMSMSMSMSIHTRNRNWSFLSLLLREVARRAPGGVVDWRRRRRFIRVPRVLYPDAPPGVVERGVQLPPLGGGCLLEWVRVARLRVLGAGHATSPSRLGPHGSCPCCCCTFRGLRALRRPRRFSYIFRLVLVVLRIRMRLIAPMHPRRTRTRIPDSNIAFPLFISPSVAFVPVPVLLNVELGRTESR